MHKDEKKNQSDLDSKIINKEDNQKAGYGGRDIPQEQQKEEE